MENQQGNGVGKSYWAFISYSHKNESWAKWLHKSLENYRVPKALVGQTTSSGTVPKRIKPIFRDRDELPSSANLSETINEALAQSKFLIVICSPVAAVSQYVNEEIRTFKRLGREEHILCLIVDGVPNAKSEQKELESFPKALREDNDVLEPLAADARRKKDGKTNAKLKLIAGILDVNYDDLKQREKIRQRWLRVRIVLMLMIIATIIGAVYLNRQIEVLNANALAEREARQSRAGALAAEAQAALELYPQRSLLLAVEAINKTLEPDDYSTFAAEEAIRQVLAETGGLSLGESQTGITVMAVTPNDRWLITGDRNGDVHLWDLLAPVPVDPIVLPHDSEIAALAVSPGSDALAVGTVNRGAYMWDLANIHLADKPRTLFNHGCPGLAQGMTQCPVNTLAFSNDSRWFAIFENGGGTWDEANRTWGQDPLRLVNVDPNHEIPPRNLMDGNLPDEHLTAMTFSPDGRWLAAGSKDSRIFLWDLSSETSIPSYFSPTGIMDGNTSVISISPNGYWLFVGTDNGEGRLWDLTAENPIAESVVLAGHEGAVISDAAFTRDGRWLATASFDDTVRLWDLSSPDPSAFPVVLRGHQDNINDIAISIDDKWLATGSEDHTVRLWNLHSVSDLQDPIVLRGHDLPVTNVEFLASRNVLLTAGMDGTIRKWDIGSIDSPTSPVIRVGDGSPVRTTAISPDGIWAASGTRSGSVYLWRLGNNDPPFALRGHGAAITDMTFSPNNHWLITASVDDTARLWDLTDEDIIASSIGLLDHEQDVNGVAVTSDSHWLATVSGDDTVRLWDLSSNTPDQNPKVLRGHDPLGSIVAVAISPDNHWLATGGWDKTTRLWDLTSDNPEESAIVLPKNSLGVFDIAFSSDSRWLVSSGNDPLPFLWDLADEDFYAKDPITLQGHIGPIDVVTFSHDNKWLATGGGPNDIEGGDSTIRIWDLTAEEIGSNPVTLQHDDWVLSAAFSPDDRWLFTGAADHHIYVWDMEDLDANPRLLRQHTDFINSLSVSPDGHWLIAASGDGTFSEWPLQIEELIRIACATAGRNMTNDEWEQYFPDEPYRRTCSDLPRHYSAPPPESIEVIFSDDYSKSGSGLTRYVEDDWGSRGYTDNEAYRFDLNPNSGPVWGIYPDKNLPPHFKIEVECSYAKANNNGYGIVFQAVDPNHFYGYRISGDGFVAAHLVEDIFWKRIVDWKPAYQISRTPGPPNKIAVVGSGDKYYLYVNDWLVSSFTDATYEAGSFGLVAENFDGESQSAFLCDDYVVSSISDEAFVSERSEQISAVSQQPVIEQTSEPFSPIEPELGEPEVAPSIMPTIEEEPTPQATVTDVPDDTNMPTILEFSVDATRELNETNIPVNQGDTVSIEYLNGEWRAGTLPDWPLVGPNGDVRVLSKATFPIADKPLMSLIAGIDDGPPVWVGERIEFESTTSGSLWLGANDDSFDDNAGILRVRITVTSATSRFSDNSASFPVWETPKLISIEALNGANLASIAADPNGDTLIIAYSKQLEGSRDRDVYYVRSNDGGLTWSSPNPIHTSPGNSTNSYYPDIVIDKNQIAHAVWGEGGTLAYAKESDWALNNYSSLATTPYSIYNPQIIASGNNNLYVTFAAININISPGVFYTNSTDGGETWNTGTIAVYGESPSLVISESDEILHVVYLNNGVYYRQGADTGREINWSEPILISDESGLALNPEIVTINGVLHVSYTDRISYDQQYIHHLECSDQCTIQPNWSPSNNPVSGQSFGTNDIEPINLSSSMANVFGCTYIYFDGVRTPPTSGNEIIWGVNDCDGWSLGGHDQVTDPAYRSIRPSIIAKGNRIHLVYEKIDAGGQIYYLRGLLER